VIANPIVGSSPAITLGGFEGRLPTRLVASIAVESGECRLLHEREFMLDYRTDANGGGGFVGAERIVDPMAAATALRRRVVVGLAAAGARCRAGLRVVEEESPESVEGPWVHWLDVHASQPVFASFEATIDTASGGTLVRNGAVVLRITITEPVDAR
jgi:hypothetical protein